MFEKTCATKQSKKTKKIPTCICFQIQSEVRQQDLKFSNLSLNDAVKMAQNRPLWRCYALLVVHATKEEEEEESDSMQRFRLVIFCPVRIKLLRQYFNQQFFKTYVYVTVSYHRVKSNDLIDF